MRNRAAGVNHTICLILNVFVVLQNRKNAACKWHKKDRQRQVATEILVILHVLKYIINPGYIELKGDHKIGRSIDSSNYIIPI